MIAEIFNSDDTGRPTAAFIHDMPPGCLANVDGESAGAQA
jgi:hypothetical protein